MAKFDGDAAPQKVGVPRVVETVNTDLAAPTTTTFEGGEGWNRTPAGELFLFALSNFVKEDTFYQAATERDKHFIDLVRMVAVDEPEPNWFARFVPYLRNTANMRSAPIVMAIEAGRAGLSDRRSVLASAMSRADEPGEAVAYWIAKYSKSGMPSWFKRGVFDAAKRLYNERAVLQYDGQDKNVRFADVIDLTALDNRIDADLWKYLQDRRHGNVEEIPASLEVIRANAAMRAIPVAERRAVVLEPGFSEMLRAAGMRWSDVSGWLQGPMDAAVWEALIPNMGYMALLRNLRNFDQADISDEAVAKVIDRLTDPEEVKRSRQFPIRFYSAYKAVESDRWLQHLSTAADMTLQNIPALAGRTLILVDTSGSMYWATSGNSKVLNWEVAALFGTALAMRSETADLYAFGSGIAEVKFSKGASLLRTVTKFPGLGGTETMRALLATYIGQDRVVIITDEQAWRGPRVGTVVNQIKVPIYTFNLVGYPGAQMPSGENRYTIGGGLTDGAFALISAIEQRSKAGWPF